MSKVYTVRQLNGYIRAMFDQDFLLSSVTVKGEISNLKDHPSGHIYLTLKDQDSSIAVVMFAGNRRGLRCRLRDGQSVRVTGSVSVYEAAGRYQLYAREISDEGEGDLFRQFQELKNRLSEMGMFDPSYKKPIPKYCRTVGIVTASSGAALRDIVQIAGRRNPGVQLVLCPALVQGQDAPKSLISAIERMDAFRPDVMIVGRGGGSLEDLWCFNDEGVARAIFDCETPVISAVGHEVDFTIADFVADLRAPTPSAAAELAVFDLRQFLQDLTVMEDRARLVTGSCIQRLRTRLSRIETRIVSAAPEKRLRDEKYRLSDLHSRLSLRMQILLEQRKQELALMRTRLLGLSPYEKLKNGYGYIESGARPVLRAADLRAGDPLTIVLHDGTVDAEVLQIALKENG